jgi:CubicO group peptidase (beta-lactamase class C family)
MKKYFFTAFIQFLFFLNALAQDERANKLTDFAEKIITELKVIPAVSIAVSDENGSLYTNALGYADVNKKIPATAETNFYIASCTKSFNGLLAVLLEEEGKIDLNQQVLFYKPFKDFKRKDIFKNITINDLLSHQSGIDNNYISTRLAYTGEYTEQEIIQLIETETKINEKGKNFEYSNFGYYLLDVLLKAELGKSWKDLLYEKVFTPLKMNHSTAYMSKTDNQLLAKPYLTLFPEEIKECYLVKTDKTMHAAGGIVSSAKDISNFLAFNISKGKIDNKQIYSAEILERTFAKQTNATHDVVKIFEGYGYARGWRLGKFKNDEVVYHFGGYSGCFSHISFLPSKKLGVAIFINHELGMPVADLIAKYAYDLYGGDISNLKKYEKEIGNLKKALKREQKGETATLKHHAKRVWLLSLPKENYAGIYYNNKIGTIEVLYENGNIIVKAGNLTAIATPYKLPEWMRLELIPGSGTGILFKIVDGKVESLSYNSEPFAKLK